MIRKFLKPQPLLLTLTCFLIAVNTIDFTKQILLQKKVRGLMPFYFSGGLKFSGLEETLRGVAVAGYYTDKNLKEKSVAAQFSQAQYILAPTILDLNNTSHEFIFFDCANETESMKKIKEIGAVAVKRNNFGIILAKKTK